MDQQVFNVSKHHIELPTISKKNIRANINDKKIDEQLKQYQNVCIKVSKLNKKYSREYL
jgi:hypothetical protein